ncbi:Gfo/Idh/MocA family protein [Amycolatopsis sp. NPDC059021]|uniref:Gfo/Idh/MocA family protein n=1 Tax=Amycolatopsis sp. NPDC059021 TaxID=3346704 RepID=UPI00366FFDD2
MKGHDRTATRRVRIGIMGCAEFARRRMAPAITEHPDIELTAVASRAPETAAATATRFACEPVTGYAELLERDDVDAVYVPLPVALIGDWALRALRAGKHVLAEKSVACAVSRARELTTCAAERGLVLLPNFLFLRHVQQRAVAKLVAAGELGELRLISAAFGFPPRPSGDIRYRRDLGGGSLAETGIYPVRLAQSLLGDGLRVGHAVLREAAGPTGAFDVAGAAQLYDEAGVVAQLAFGFDHSYRCDYEIWGSKGRVRVERAFTPPADWEPVVWWERDGGRERLPLAPDDHVRNLLTEFCARVRGERAAGAEPAAVVETARLLEEISAKATG